jgi:hypothetical protein
MGVPGEATDPVILVGSETRLVRPAWMTGLPCAFKIDKTGPSTGKRVLERVRGCDRFLTR